MVVSWIGIPAIQAGRGKVIVGDRRRPMGWRMSKFFGHPERQVFSRNIAEDIFTFDGGDGDILRATGAASSGTNGGEALAPVGKNLIKCIQNERFHALLFPCSFQNKKG